DEVDRGDAEEAVLVGGADVADMRGGGRDDPDGALEIRVREGTVDHCTLSTDRVRSPSGPGPPAGRTVGVSGTRFSREPSSRRIVEPLVEPRSVTTRSSPDPSTRRCVLEAERVSSFITNSSSPSTGAGLRPTTTALSTTRSAPS